MSEQQWTPPAYNLSSVHASARVMIAGGVEGAGRRGWLVGSILEINGMRWAPVLWDGEEDPDFFKAHCLKVQTWQPFQLDQAGQPPDTGKP